MSFTVELMRNNSEDNKIGKSLSMIRSVSGTLREECSITNPSITIEGDLSDIVGCNYMRITAFNRCYFITDIKSLRNDLYQVTGRCDVLESYKSEILLNKAIIKRQENNWNLYLDDSTFKVYNNPNIITRSFPAGFNTFEFVLCVAGD